MNARVIIWIVIIVGIVIVGILFFQGAQNKSIQEKPISFENLTLDIPNRETMSTVVVRNDKEWTDLFGAIPSTVDFNQKTALVISMGKRMTGGYSIEVKSILQKRDKISASVEFISPGKNCITTQVVNYPAQIVLIPATKTEIVWEISNRTMDCPQ